MVNEATTTNGRGAYEVKVMPASTVAPATPVREHRLPLSNLDLLLPPEDVRVFFCYADDPAGNNNSHPAATLKAALAKTLVGYYPLAGEVVANAAGEPELLCSGRGVDVAEAYADGTELRELRLGLPDESIEQLLPKKKAGIMCVQVTKFRCGGVAVGCCFDHRVCDAYSFNMFLVAWAAAARGSSSASPAPSFDRAFLAPSQPAPPCTSGTLADRLFVPVSRARAPPPAAKLDATNRIYRVAAADIAALQQASTGRTKLEAFTAHLWKLHARAAASSSSASAPSSSCTMGVLVEGRSRMCPDGGATKAYFGNVLTLPYGVIGSEDLRGTDLADVADDVHRLVAEAATGDHFRGLVDLVEALRPEPMLSRAYLSRGGSRDDDGEDATSTICVVSSGLRFPLEEVDFGWGRPALASYLFPFPCWAGYVMPMPSPRGDGDWVVYVHAAPDVVAALEEEPTVFRALESDYVFGEK